MSLLKVDTIQGRSGTDISVGSGHTLKDASGNAFNTSGGLDGFQQFRLNANLTSNAQFITLSDEREKENITPVVSVLDKVMNLS